MLLVNDSEERWRFPWMTTLIILGCGAAFWWEQRLGAAGTTRAFREWGFVPAEARAAWVHRDTVALAHAFATLLTCQFLHAGWLHLIGNLWML